MGGFQRKLPVESFILCLMIIWMGLLFNEGESRVKGRSKISYGKNYSKDILNIQITGPSPSKGIDSKNTSFCSFVSWSMKNCVLGPLSVGKDFAPSVYAQLCPRPYGKFRAHISCDLYILCHNGSLTVNRCPDSSIFNASIHDCTNSSDHSGCSQSDVSSELRSITSLMKTELINRNGTNTNSLEEDHNSEVVDGIRKTNKPDSQEKSDDERRNKKEEKSREISELSIQTSETRSNVSSSHSSRLGESLLESESRHPKEKEVEVGLCANSGNGIFPHPNSCEHFIQCVHGTANVQSCALGTVFNPQTSVCDWETNVPECDSSSTLLVSNNRVRRSMTHPNHIISDVNGLLSPQGMALSKHILSRKRRSPNGQRGRKCTPSEEYVQPHSIHCNKFEICSNGRIVEETCGRGTLFNPLSLVCDFPDNVDCESRKVDFSTYDCKKDHEYRASHPETCNKFIECDHGVLQIKTCSPGTLYNREEEKCDFAHKVKCQKPISLEHDVDVNYLPRLGRSLKQNPLNLACDYNYIAPHPRFCNQFVECENGRIFIKSCGPGTVFNGEIGQCDWAYNTRQPDLLDCSQYVECERGQYSRKYCLRNTIYDPKTKKCVFDRFGRDNCRRPPITSTPPPS